MRIPKIAPHLIQDPNTKHIYPSRTNWVQEYGLKDLRKIPSYDPLWQGLAHGHWQKITPEMAIETERYASLPPWEKARAVAAATALSLDRSAVCGLSAARLWNLWTPSSHDEKVEVNMLGGTKPPGNKQRKAHLEYRSAMLHPDELLVVDGARVTGLSRTLYDLIRFHSPETAVVALDSFRAASPTATPDNIANWILENRSQRNRKRFERVLSLSTSKSESPLESKARFRLLNAKISGLEHLEFQRELIAGAQLIRPDFLLNGWLIVEVDGRTKYESNAEESIRQEREREMRLRHEGYQVLRIHREDIDNGSFLALIARELNGQTSRRPARPA